MTDEALRTSNEKNVAIFIEGLKIIIKLRNLGLLIISVGIPNILIGRKEKIFANKVPVKGIRHFLRDCQTLAPEGLELGTSDVIMLMPVHVSSCPGKKILGFLKKIDPTISITVNNEHCTGDCKLCAVPAMLAR